MNTKTIKHEGKINLLGVKISCYILEDGTRILSVQGMQEVLKKIGSGYSKQKPANWYKQHLEKRSQAFFTHDKTTPIIGLEATMLEDLFDTCLKAIKSEVKLSPKRRLIVKQHEMLSRSFAKVGITALVDEATGYQRGRENLELQKILKSYVLRLRATKLISESEEEFNERLRKYFCDYDDSEMADETVSKESFDKALKTLLNTPSRKSKQVKNFLKTI